MTGFQKWILMASILMGLVDVGMTAPDSCKESCWESCVQNFNLESYRYKEVYDNLLEIAFEIIQLKNIYNVTRIGWVIDSALSMKHNRPEVNMTSSLENGNNIFQFEILLVMALVSIVNGQYNYFVQYDESSAWTCNEFNCVASNCPSIAAINKLNKVKMLPTSHCPGNVEAACKLLNDRMTGTCAAGNTNSMVVAVTNGDFYTSDPDRNRKSFNHRPDHVCPPFHWGGLNSASSSSSSSSSSEEDLFSPCHSYFDTRYVVGTHDPHREVMELFPSKHGNYRYFHDEKFSYDALVNFVNCVISSATTNCCATPLPPPTVTTCYKTQGPFGEVISDDTTNPALTASTSIFGAPLNPIPTV